jgi:hypothetical protein
MAPQREENGFKTMKMTRRDIYQRKAYAIRRMSLALNRFKQALTPEDREKASYWIKIWSAVSRIRRFKLGNGGVDRRKSRSLVNSYPKQSDPL